MRSKKRSAASSSPRPPSLPVLFLDRSLGRQIVAGALRAAGAVVEIHDDHFPPDALDREWLAAVGRRGWVVLTKDQRIRYRAIERAALLEAGVRAFVLAAGELRGVDMGRVFVRALPAMGRAVIQHSPPFIARVSRGGAVSMLVRGPGAR